MFLFCVSFKSYEPALQNIDFSLLKVDDVIETYFDNILLMLERVYFTGALLSFFLIIIIAILIFVYQSEAKRYKIQEQEKNNEIKKKEQDLFSKEKEILQLNEKYIFLENEMITLQNTENESILSYKNEVQKKGEEINKLKMEIENRRFMLKPIYEHLVEIERQVKSRETTTIKTTEFDKVYNEIESSFHELIVQIKKEYPAIDKENIFILCLYKYGFTSKTIAQFLNITDSTVRKRIERLRSKISYFSLNN